MATTQSSAPEAGAPISSQARLEKSHEILTCTIRAPPFSYAHLEVITDGADPVELDNLQVKAYCTAALKQFMGITGAAIALDVLKVTGNECWLRVPRPDLGKFAAAVTSWRGVSEGDSQRVFRVRQCSDWLGTMAGSDGQDRLWNP